MNRIREARKAAGLTQREMADLFGMPKRTIENWEYHKTEPPEWVERLVLGKLEKINKAPNP